MRTEEHRVICFGEALADCFADGNVIGGAPLNVARHMAQLGCDTYIMTALANDSIGSQIRQACALTGVKADLITTTDRAGTGKVLVHQLDNGTHEFEIEKDSAWDHIDLAEPSVSIVQTADCLIYGTLALRRPHNRKTLNRVLDKFDGLVVCDFNWREGHIEIGEAVECIRHAHWLKLNETELELLLNHLGLTDPQELIAHLGLELCLITRGPEGYQVYDREGELLRGDACAVRSMADTVGAGDSFLACTLAAHLKGLNLEQSLIIAARLAAEVCCIRGAVSTDPGFYIPFRASIQSELNKLVNQNRIENK